MKKVATLTVAILVIAGITSVGLFAAADKTVGPYTVAKDQLVKQDMELETSEVTPENAAVVIKVDPIHVGGPA